MQRFWRSGDPFVWLTGGALALSLLMILGLLLLIFVNGLRQFWAHDLTEFRLKSGEKVLGEIWDTEDMPNATPGTDGRQPQRFRVKIGNRDVYALDFKWLDETEIEHRRKPETAFAMERDEWGNFYGYFKALQVDGEIVATDYAAGKGRIDRLFREMHRLRAEIRGIEKGQIGAINHDLERLRLARQALSGTGDEERIAGIDAQIKRLNDDYHAIEARLSKLYETSGKAKLLMTTVDGHEKAVKIYDIVRMYQPNRMNFLGKGQLYLSKVWEFVSAEPRESNTEGGIFPAIFGTVLMVIIMSIAVVPFGVLAAIYLREYARQGTIVRLIRIAVNNLAGVPSIVYGVFGLAFFIYTIGGTIDRLFYPELLPTPTFGTGGILWASLTLALLTVPVVIVATEEGLAAVPRELREGSLALAATKFETLWRVVIPSALPGIMTGVILAIARAAGEVAPLMITGVVKLAPTLPLDGRFPFLHLERKFMHLGFHIYDVGFQSPNVEAAIPMVYSTTLLLIAIVVVLNVLAMYVRNRIRKKIVYSVF